MPLAETAPIAAPAVTAGAEASLIERAGAEPIVAPAVTAEGPAAPDDPAGTASTVTLPAAVTIGANA